MILLPNQRPSNQAKRNTTSQGVRPYSFFRLVLGSTRGDCSARPRLLLEHPRHRQTQRQNQRRQAVRAPERGLQGTARLQAAWRPNHFRRPHARRPLRGVGGAGWGGLGGLGYPTLWEDREPTGKGRTPIFPTQFVRTNIFRVLDLSYIPNRWLRTPHREGETGHGPTGGPGWNP